MGMRTLRIPDKEMLALETEIKTSKRSLASQAAYWMNIGKAVEESNLIDKNILKEVLKKPVNPDDLSASEQDAFFESLNSQMWDESPAVDAAYAKLVADEGGVGLDENDNLVFQEPAK